jgi:hypothetical protein
MQEAGYDWATLNQHLTLNNAPLTADTRVLNPGTLSSFISNYLCDNEGHTLSKQASFLEEQAGRTIQMYLTAPLSTDAWALFLETCRTHQVRVQLRCAPGVALPMELNHAALPEVPLAVTPWAGQAPQGDCCIDSTDGDVTTRQLKPDCVLDVSEAEPGHLLERIHAQLNKETVEFSFSTQQGALVHLLEQGKTVVLKGAFSPALEDALNAFCLKRQHDPKAQGKLVLIPNQPSSFSLLPALKHVVSMAEKKACLPKHAGLQDSDYDKPLPHLEAMLRFARIHPDAPNLTQAWAGMECLPERDIAWSGSLEQAQAETEAIEQQRLHSLEAVLTQASFAFIAGTTGVGKTTFLHETWKKHHPALFIGEQALSDWAHSSEPGLKVLFIDEATLSSRNWSEFESLCNSPPGIRVDNQFIPLSEHHKVIFAGNPLSFGGERTLPSLLARHGNSVIFDPLPPAFLYHRILEPLFKAAGLSDEAARQTAGPLLLAAQMLTQYSTKETLISPRELSMMALLTIAYHQRYPEANLHEVARAYAYQLSTSLVPQAKQAHFNDQWGPNTPLASDRDKKPATVRINDSNRPALHALNDALAVRTLRQINPDMQGGLGGLILEGEPGIGKSELVIQTLLAHGLTKAKPNETKPNTFYVLNADLAPPEMEALLRKAFDEGAVVIIDELNSTSMMERLLNDLLMGKTPEGIKPKNPGFTLIATQNPATMAGRQRATQALQRRLHTVVIPPYSTDEMRDILLDKGLPCEDAEELLDEYNNLNDPSVCFRNAVRLAEEEVKARNRRHEKVQAVRTHFKAKLQDYVKQQESFSTSFYNFWSRKKCNDTSLAKELAKQLDDEAPMDAVFAHAKHEQATPELDSILKKEQGDWSEIASNY